MKLHRFFIPQFTDQYKPSVGADIVYSGTLLHQFVNVLRFQSGDRVVIFDGGGIDYTVKFVSLSKKAAAICVESVEQNIFTPKKIVNVFLSFIKKDRFETALEKLTELGVTSITPLCTEYTQVVNMSHERMEKIIIEASEQCERSDIPKLHETLNLKDFCSQESSPQSYYLMFHPDKPTTKGEKGLETLLDKKEVTLLIGPEGGFSEHEVKEFENKIVVEGKGAFVLLGKNILRTETAAIVATERLLLDPKVLF